MHRKVILSLTLLGLSFPFFSSCGNNKIPLRGQTITGEYPPANALLAEARALQSAGKNKKAISRYKDVFEDYPNSTAAPEAIYAKAYLLDQQGDLMKAFDDYESLIVNYQGSPRYASALKRQKAVAIAAANGVIKNNFLGLKTRIAPSKIEKMLTKVRDNAPKAPSAAKAQFTIGQVWQNSGNDRKAIAAYRQMSVNYPDSPQAPEALYQIGQILVQRNNHGNKNKANLDNAINIYNDLIQRYPNHKRAADAKKAIKSLKVSEIQRNYNIAEFYRKKEQPQSAIFYYKEVLKQAKSGPLRDRASKRIAELKNQR